MRRKRLGYLHTSGDPFSSLLRQARALFRDFHQFAPHPFLPGAAPFVRCHRRRAPRILTPLGQLKGLIYSSDRGQCGRPRTFVHFMETPPLLASNPGGTQLYILGGRYRVTRKGIVG